MSCRLLQRRSFVTSSPSSVTAQKSKGPWPPEEEAGMKSSRWSARRHMSQDYRGVLLPVGTPSAVRAAGERPGLGWGRQCIPEHMTGCSRSDRPWPWLMKPKHFYRCFYTLGSTRSHQHSPTSPFPIAALSPARVPYSDALMQSLPFSSRSALWHRDAEERRSPLCRMTHRCCFSLAWQAALVEI